MVIYPWDLFAHYSLLDILTIPHHRRGAALVYFTADGIVSGPLLFYRPELSATSSIYVCGC